MKLEPGSLALPELLETQFRRLRAAERREPLEASLTEFIKSAWRYIDPAPYVDGWHIDAIAEHLEAVASGDIRRLIINVPPRTSKSSIVSVAFPAWVWAQDASNIEEGLRGPSIQFLTSSYASSLSARDAQKMRRLVESPWYQSLWGERYQLLQSTITKFDNDKGGYRISTSTGAQVTGWGGDIIMIDDPHNALEPESEVMRQGTIDWWDQAISTRLNNPKKGAYIVIMQRLHEEDLTGHILDSEEAGEWTHLCLPMRYEADRHCKTSIGWEDPRGYDARGNRLSFEESDGALLCPSRFGEREVARIEANLSPWGAAGQLQQKPQPRGGALILDEWWRRWDREAQQSQDVKPGNFPDFDYILASYDGAFTEKEENDPSALTVWGVWKYTTAEARQQAVNQYGDASYAFGRQCLMLVYAWRKRLTLNGSVVADISENQLMQMWVSEGKAEGYEAFKLKEKERKKDKWGIVQHIAETCRKFKVDKLLIEAKANGMTVAQELRRLFANETWAETCQLYAPTKDKIARVLMIQHLFADGTIWAPDPLKVDWADMVMREFESFPKGKHDDLVDSSSAAIQQLRRMNFAQMGHEAEDSKEQTLFGSGPKRPLINYEG